MEREGRMTKDEVVSLDKDKKTWKTAGGTDIAFGKLLSFNL